MPCPLFMTELYNQLDAHQEYNQLRQEILKNPEKHAGLSLAQKLILRKGRIWLPRDLEIIPILLVEYHTTPTGGHMGVAKTIACLMENFDWEGLRADVTKFVAQCLDC